MLSAGWYASSDQSRGEGESGRGDLRSDHSGAQLRSVSLGPCHPLSAQLYRKGAVLQLGFTLVVLQVHSCCCAQEVFKGSEIWDEVGGCFHT